MFWNNKITAQHLLEDIKGDSKLNEKSVYGGPESKNKFLIDFLIVFEV